MGETKNYKDNIEPFLLEVGLPAMKLRDELDGGESKKGLDQIYDPHDPEAYGFPVHNDEYRDPKFKQFRRAFSKIAVAIVTDDEDCETEIGRIHIDIKDVKKGFRVETVGDVQGGSQLQHQISTMVLQMPFGERRQYPPELSFFADKASKKPFSCTFAAPEGGSEPQIVFGAYNEIFHGLTFDAKKEVEVGRERRSRKDLVELI